MLDLTEHYQLLKVESMSGETMLAYCPSYESGVHGVVRIGQQLYSVVETDNFVKGTVIAMVGAQECDATYSIGWERPQGGEETEDEENA